MLWFDDDKTRTLTQKIERGAEFYRTKYGLQPTQCYLHPNTLALDPELKRVGTVVLCPMKPIITHHFWFGQDDNQPGPKHPEQSAQISK